MNDFVRVLEQEDYEGIVELIEHRQMAFEDKEDLRTSILVVLLNFGNRFATVDCMMGEWSGLKSDLISVDGGVPKCPNGHVCFEGPGYKLAWVREER